MEEPKMNFSADGNGYNRKEVDAYFEKLQEQFREISEKNQKLYHDCVHFAKQLKKIQDSGVLDEDVPALKRQNAKYRQEIQNLRSQLAGSSSESADSAKPRSHEPSGYFNTPSPEEVTPQSETSASASQEGAVFFDDQPDDTEASAEVPKKTHRVLRGFLIFFLVIFILVAIISAASGIVGHNSNPQTSCFGVRGYCITNNNLASVANKGTVVLVKYEQADELTPGKIVLAHAGGIRTLGTIQRAVISNGRTSYELTMDHGPDAVISQQQYLGTAKYRIAGIGNFVTWAVSNAITYFLILFVILALLVLLIALIPSAKKVREENEAAEAAASLSQSEDSKKE